MMKNKSTLAKLLAEEDIFVVHKQMETAYFNSKSRELGLPIWKDEDMTKDIYDLLIGHEIGHALWTPLSMLEEARVRGINGSFVNILEDVRVEKFAVQKYPGFVGVFKRGYTDLVKRDFFGTSKKPVDSFGLIDRINLFYKSGDTSIWFSDAERPWVEKVGKTETPDDVLDLAEELYKFMDENPESKGENFDDDMPIDGSGVSDKMGEDGSSPSNTDDDDDESGDAFGNGADGNDDDTDESGDASGNGADGNDDDDLETDKTDGEDKSSSEEGGKNSTGKGGPPTAETDTASNKAMDELRDKTAEDRIYANIPKVDLDKIIVNNKTLLDEFKTFYLGRSSVEGSLYWDKTLEEVETLKNESKKTVAYMVKEFEMKKSADAYARASTSKTGSLDMDKLHTYKYNEDLFKKVTTLPGATNHGMVMVLDWSGSMGANLKGTLSQLYNLIWFCRRTAIPFEVFAFSDQYGRVDRLNVANADKRTLPNFKAGDLVITDFKLLNFFSSNLTVSDEMDMMHILWMYACCYSGYRDHQKDGYPYNVPTNLYLGGTPLNDTIIAMMGLLPKFKADTGVQKVNTIFLTDGASHGLTGIYDYRLDTNTGEHTEIVKSIPSSYAREKLILSDRMMNKTYEIGDVITNDLLVILKNQVPGMNIVGFFIAGTRRSGRVDKQILYGLLPNEDRNTIMEKVKFLNKNKYLALNQLGYDEYYILPGGNALKTENETLDDELIGAGKAKLKSAFTKMSKGKLASRQLLNKFVSMVA